MLLEETIRSAKQTGRLTKCYDEVNSTNFPDEEIRDNLTLVSLSDLGLDPQSWYLTSQILQAMEACGYSPATMIELAHYAATAWDQVAYVAALGKPWVNPANVAARAERAHLWDDFVIHIEYGGNLQPVRDSVLLLGTIATENHPWSDRYRFLVVPE